MAQQIKLKPGHKFVQLLVVPVRYSDTPHIRTVTRMMRPDEKPETYYADIDDGGDCLSEYEIIESL